ncbi:MAG: IclR family transcriptional regulator, partial [Dehalococcoidia bacterium]
AERDCLNFTELARRLELPKSSLHELLDVLATRSYITLDQESRRYSLGVRVWELGQAYVRYRELVRESLPVMTGIVRLLNETVQLSVLDGMENVYLAKVDCTHPVRLQSQVGKRLPAHATGLGKVLLAELAPAERDARIRNHPLARFTNQTITGLPALERELAAIRERGFALDDQEYTPGLRCVAVPIRDHLRQTAASISVSIPSIRAEPAQLALALRQVAAASLEISRRLGGAGDDPDLGRLLAATDDELRAVIAGALAARATSPVGSRLAVSVAAREE